MMIVCDTGKIRIAPAHVNAAEFAASGPKVGEARSVRVDDTLLIREAQQGNTAAFEELVRQYDRAVLRLAVHLTGSQDRKSTRLNSSHLGISYAVFCLKKKKTVKNAYNIKNCIISRKTCY